MFLASFHKERPVHGDLISIKIIFKYQHMGKLKSTNFHIMTVVPEIILEILLLYF